jgi:glycosyltransferase involved in cell wall biosynthesis
MTSAEQKLAICICTYQRPQLLKRLISDLREQSHPFGWLIVVDGDPASGQVRSVLKEGAGFRVIYQPSNHPNQPYQRFLGWRIAAQEKVDLLVYFDDDIRFLESDALEKIVRPFSWTGRRVAGVTANTISPNRDEKLSAAPALLEQTKKKRTPVFVEWLGDSKRTAPGGLTASGQRVPLRSDGLEYANVECLQGRVMAFRMSALERANFPDDLFAVKQVNAGMGEDTLISHGVLTRGELLLACEVLVEHPDDDLPNSYPHQSFWYGFAVAYSRRLLNDYFRFPGKPFLMDRIALCKSYLGNFILNWGCFLLRPRGFRFQYAAGYTWGVVRAFINPPRAKNLTPHIDWDADAERAIASREIIGAGS